MNCVSNSDYRNWQLLVVIGSNGGMLVALRCVSESKPLPKSKPFGILVKKNKTNWYLFYRRRITQGMTNYFGNIYFTSIMKYQMSIQKHVTAKNNSNKNN